jgi:hypothetical protein
MIPISKVVIESIIIFFNPITSNNAAINGPDIPYKKRLMAKASAITDRSQPNSFSKGSMKTPDDDMTIPATIMEKNVMARINQL